jgi:hypothetical protein
VGIAKRQRLRQKPEKLCDFVSKSSVKRHRLDDITLVRHESATKPTLYSGTQYGASSLIRTMTVGPGITPDLLTLQNEFKNQNKKMQALAGLFRHK